MKRKGKRGFLPESCDPLEAVNAIEFELVNGHYE